MNWNAGGESASWPLWGGNAKTVRFTSVARQLTSEGVPHISERRRRHALNVLGSPALKSPILVKVSASTPCLQSGGLV